MEHSGTDEAGKQNPAIVLWCREKLPLYFEHFIENLYEQD